ncbi:hypothetical protein FACS1894186_0770 [Alphaproteobacteria bacterium]|nr:hypothetical protein FACS1894186_0770 [Alphaproteobacteria bacterium]
MAGMMRFSDSQRGNNMMETIGFLAILCVMILAGVAGYRRGLEIYRTNVLQSDVESLVGSIQVLFQSNYTEKVSIARLKAMGAARTDPWLNPWRKPYNVWQQIPGDTRFFVVSTGPDIPRRPCVEILQSFFARSEKLRLINVRIIAKGGGSDPDAEEAMESGVRNVNADTTMSPATATFDSIMHACASINGNEIHFALY